MSDHAHINGIVQKVIYRNEDSYFTVATLKSADFAFPITITGILEGIREGENLEIEGKWEEHPSYGKQIVVTNYKIILPTQKESLRRYLASGVIKGIGKAYAERLVSHFGEDVLKVIEEEPERLAEVEGFGSKRIRMVKAAWKKEKMERANLEQLMLYLLDQGIGKNTVIKVYSTLGEDALPRIKENPYILADKVQGIGFKKADSIAIHTGMDPHSPERIKAALKYLLNQGTGEGHSFLQKSTVLELAQTMLEAAPDLIDEQLQRLAHDREVVIEEDAVYLPPYYYSELKASEKIFIMLRSKSKLYDSVTIENKIRDSQIDLGIGFTEEQHTAIRYALTNRITIITGGPGTGKTTIIKAITDILCDTKSRFELAAPTGRASKRLSEATGCSARTIHRLLEYQPFENKFNRNLHNPLNIDTLILDEVSMIDIILFYHLLTALKPETKLILVGDANQLPSVGPGMVLHDLINSGQVPLIKLTEIHRQAQKSLIVKNSHKILKNEFPIFWNKEGSDFFFLSEEVPVRAAKTIAQLVYQRLPQKYGFDPIWDIQVITPMYKAPVGADNLNLLLQESLNPNQSLSPCLKKFCKGDKVMQLVNNYEKDIYNGDIGQIHEIFPNKENLIVKFPEKMVAYKSNELDQLTLAYAISIHKSQGSEFPAVIIPLYTQHALLLRRNLLYTALTRAKKIAILIGTYKALGMAVHNNELQERNSGFLKR
ncbi:ATP-dependent RecD-like DNA helicase, partial [bacterium]|nr:ATP-dependent RecD-like DNA helicase [bacterium]